LEKKEKIIYYAFIVRRNRLFLVGLGIVALLAFAAIFAPWITTHPEDAFGEIDILNKLEPPSREYLFGTDLMGRDIFSRVIFGTRKSLVIGFGIVLIALGIGVPLGLVAGYFGGYTDEIIMRITDGFMAFPPLLLPIAIGGALGSSMTINMIAIALAWWPLYVRLLRAQVLVVREQLYIDAAKSIGVKSRTIIMRHVISNSISPVIVNASLDLGYAILMSAGLSFIGIGAKPPVAEWGLMINEGRAYFLDYWWTTTFPGLAIFIAVLGFNLIGDGLRDILDPKVRGRV
jgi:peptide/nickel transport system permease protein